MFQRRLYETNYKTTGLSRALRPPSYIRDSTQLVEPVALLDKGIPSNAYEFRGVGTILPKFAYTETYDPKFY